ncbi:MAG: DUF4203 domain-containing protein, partial [Paracoccaceae bacterium]
MITISRLLVGILLLLLGQRLYWLFAGLLGFVVTTDIVAGALQIEPAWVVLVIALVVGLIGAVFAVFLQKVAIGIAGFLAGGYIVFTLMGQFGLDPSATWMWIPLLLGGIVGSALASALFDWALVVLSSLAGAGALVQG